MTIVEGIDPATGQGIAVEFDGGLIAAIHPVKLEQGPFLSAGLVDLQVNGFAGLDLNSGHLTPDTVIELCRKMLSLGVTTWLPTLITAPESAITQALQQIAEARKIDILAERMIPCVHVEGPSISILDGPRGAHPLAHVRPPSLAEFERWQAVSGDLVGMVTLAPEHEGALAYISDLSRRGIHVAIGHTAATADQIREAVAAGAALSTHLGNGATSILPRHPNFIWAQLADDRLSASFIADGWHLPADTFRAMLRAKGLDRAILVSDSVALAGMPAGLYEQVIGGAVEVSAEGRIGVAGTPYLAGAGLPLAANVAIAMEMAGISLDQALTLATINPGRFAGGRGRLAVGERADLIGFNWRSGDRQLHIANAWLSGEEVWHQ